MSDLQELFNPEFWVEVDEEVKALSNAQTNTNTTNDKDPEEDELQFAPHMQEEQDVQFVKEVIRRFVRGLVALLYVHLIVYSVVISASRRLGTSR